MADAKASGSSASPRTGARVVCTCTTCATQSFTNEFGQSQSGRLVAASTRTNHRKKDNLAASTPLPDPVPVLTLERPTATVVPTNASVETGRQMSKENWNVADVVDSNEGFNSPVQAIFALACTLAAWLHLVCGLSRAATGSVLKVLGIMIHMAVNLGRLVPQSTPPLVSQSTSALPSTQPSIPHDVRTAMSALSLEPNIIRSICCPKCYQSYSIESLPEICLRRESSRSKPCGEVLWTTRTTRGGPKRVPRRLYSTQNFEDWLEFFLSRPGVEDIIDKSYTHSPPSDSDTMYSVWDSPAWRSLGPFTMTPNNLTFSYYIDWFNPFMNKIAGKSVSCGAIMMFCLNLPYELQQQPENIFFAGITPPPKEPSVTTITALSDPIVDRLEEMWHGKVIRTHRHPEGIFKRAAVLTAIGDLLAMRKALGFAGTASHHFCSFCTLRRADMDDLDYKSWQLRAGVDVLAAAEQWRAATTKKHRSELFAKNGVRWSSLHRLLYRDPVRHTILGVMHNWIEGVLQHHARVKWGIGAGTDMDTSDDVTATQLSLDNWHHSEDSDPDMLDDEIEALQIESQQFTDTPSHLKRLHTEASLLQDSSDMPRNEDMNHDENFCPDEESESDDSDSEQGDPNWKAVCTFDAVALSKVHLCLSTAVIPSWMERPPTNLGDKSHGKLKADHWLVLFSVFLPLILPELWLPSSKSRNIALLDNFYALVTCTNIVCAYTATPTAADAYLDHYIKYRESSGKLFPNVNSRPNHHYAMHNADLMKFWGPLIKLSEFPFEQQNGRLQKIKTNGHLWELDFTMLCQICRRGRLMAFINNSVSSDSYLKKALHILGRKMEPHNEKIFTPFEKAQENGIGQKLPLHIYDLIFEYATINHPTTTFRHFKNLPHPIDSCILPPLALPVRHITYKGRNFSTFGMHPGNSSISFYSRDGTVNAGFIDSMWRQVLDGKSQTFIIVSPHPYLSAEDETKNPYSSKPGLLCNIFYTQTPSDPHIKPIIIQQDKIIGHVAYYNRPPGTFGIKRATSIFVDSLHRNRQ